MTKVKRTITAGVLRIILAALAILCLLGVGFISTTGNSSVKDTGGLAPTLTPDNLTGEPLSVSEVAHEPDVTLGIVLAGVLLMVVILFGTLHATRGLRPPPSSK
jgi:hypothetical protein